MSIGVIFMLRYSEQVKRGYTIFKNIVNHVVCKFSSPFDISSSWVCKKIFNQVCSRIMYNLCSFIRRDFFIRHDILKIRFQVLKVFLLVSSADKKPVDVLSYQ